MNAKCRSFSLSFTSQGEHLAVPAAPSALYGNESSPEHVWGHVSPIHLIREQVGVCALAVLHDLLPVLLGCLGASGIVREIHYDSLGIWRHEPAKPSDLQDMADKFARLETRHKGHAEIFTIQQQAHRHAQCALSQTSIG